MGADLRALKRELRRFRQVDNRRAALWVAVDLIGFATTSCVASYLGPGIPGAVASVCCGLFILRAFVLGHDAGHLALFSGRTANALLGRALMLPALVSFSRWCSGHNLGHHGYANLAAPRGDRIWVPLTVTDYRALSPMRAAWERLKRHPLGIGWYYAVELWLPDLVVPTAMPLRREMIVDTVLLVLFATAWVAAAIAVGRANDMPAAAAIGMGVALPVAVWMNAMSWVIYLHHTHPDAVWFRSFSRWRGETAGRGDWVLTELGGGLDALLHNITLHPAHHLDTRIPFHRLPAANAYLVDRGLGLMRQRLTPGVVNRIAATCKLYDFDAGAWRPFPRTRRSRP